MLVTLAMDDASFAHFNALRQAHFPPERNHIPAHITLLHHLPGEEEDSVRAALATHAAQQPAFTLRTSGVWMMGFGVAYLLESHEAQALQQALKHHFNAWLTPQDAKPHFKAHITVQNKTTALAAKALHADLLADFTPQPITAVGVDVWHYLGGPWQHRARFAFST